MVRFKNIESGVIVDVPEEVGASLAGFEPVEGKKPAAKPTSTRSAKKPEK